MKVEVIIFSQEKTTTKFDFSHYKMEYNQMVDKVKLQSEDYDSFKDSYSLDYLLTEFARSEVLDE